MRLAITGKGGVGKTTLAGLLARSYAAEGRPVLAIDADPDANLASALGVPAQRLRLLQPLSRMGEAAEERLGERLAAAPGIVPTFPAAPKMDALPGRFLLRHAGVRLLQMGSVDHAGGGCACPQHAVMRSLMKHLLLEEGEVVILDMEAGLEHLARGTAEAVDLLVAVVEPGQRALQTAFQIERLAGELGIRRVAYVANKVAGEADFDFLSAALPAERLIGRLSLDEAIRLADRHGCSPYEVGGTVLEEVAVIKAGLAALMFHPAEPADEGRSNAPDEDQADPRRA